MTSACCTSAPSAAVHAAEAGHEVTLFDMARQAGGRARSTTTPAGRLDNGQHILIGAYVDTLSLLTRVGVDIAQAFDRRPLTLRYPDGSGLTLPPGPPWLAFARGVIAARGWGWRDRLGLLSAAARWASAGFRCDDTLSVDLLCSRVPAAIRRDLIEPLCVAALNTRSDQASARVFLRVLRDALFSGRGSADLLLPRQGLSALLPERASAWLQIHGATLRWGQRVQAVRLEGTHWRVDGETFDTVILACTSVEAARLTAPVAPAWSAQAAALRFSAITTIYLADAQLRLPTPMTALRASATAPAQYAFDLGALGAAPGLFAFVISGSDAWVERGLDQTADAVRAQARQAFAGAFTGPHEAVIRHAAHERRATFACTPGLQRPPMDIAPRLLAAADYVDGPYPATLEGAVRAGRVAADRIR
ncbi:MAG: FAD-dependent oxidoreductase [Burkholderiales bacterium]|nr:FAD-dependent oxidoreductase [Burkholderiales bacterium]